MESTVFVGFFCLIALIVVIFIVGLFILLGYRRRLKHKEMLAMMEKGLIEPPPTNHNGKDTLRWGIAITAIGLAFCIGLYPLGFAFGVGEFPLYFGPWMLIGLIPTFFGLALIVIYLVTKERKEKKEEGLHWLPPQDEPTTPGQPVVDLPAVDLSVDDEPADDQPVDDQSAEDADEPLS